MSEDCSACGFENGTHATRCPNGPEPSPWPNAQPTPQPRQHITDAAWSEMGFDPDEIGAVAWRDYLSENNFVLCTVEEWDERSGSSTMSFPAYQRQAEQDIANAYAREDDLRAKLAEKDAEIARLRSTWTAPQDDAAHAQNAGLLTVAPTEPRFGKG
jgi:hypothetical protein